MSMKYLFYLTLISLILYGCTSTTKTTQVHHKKLPKDAVVIANDSLQYELIIYDIGYKTYLNTIAKPENFYNLNYYENKNRFFVSKWNYRARNPFRFDDTIYINEINYDDNVSYGLEVNYKLYNYFKFVEYKYHQHF